MSTVLMVSAAAVFAAVCGALLKRGQKEIALLFSLAAAVFFLVMAFFRDGIARLMGEAYVAHPEYVVWVGLIILFDVWACIPFSRLREQGRAMTFVGLKALNVVLNVVLAFGFGAAGLLSLIHI